jgi:hypothetical protein
MPSEVPCDFPRSQKSPGKSGTKGATDGVYSASETILAGINLFCGRWLLTAEPVIEVEQSSFFEPYARDAGAFHQCGWIRRLPFFQRKALVA